MTSLSQPLDNSLDLFWHHLTHGNIVQKEERLGTTGKNVIDTVVNNINTDGIMSFQGIGNLELGADPINTGDQNRMIESPKFKKPAKEPGTSQNLGTEGGFGVLPN